MAENYQGKGRKPGKPGQDDPREDGGGAGGGDRSGEVEQPGENIIRIVAGDLPAAIDQAEAALLAAGPGPIFQRAGQLVHIADLPARRSDGGRDQQQAIVAIAPAALLEALAKVATFKKFDSRANGLRAIDPPPKLADAYMARPHWRVPDLHQLLGTPTIRRDGSVLEAPGYDAATGLYLVSELPVLDVPDNPSNRQAEAASELLTGLLSSFPFVDEPAGLALSVALAGLVGAVLRPTLPAAPLIGITAPAPGTGKSYLVDLIAIIATERRAACVATGAKPEEFEKALGAALLDGRPLLTLDNMVQPLSGQLLCMSLTQERVSVRLLGYSKNVDVPASAAMFATGNNLRISGDMARRVLICKLDALVERPEDREFDADLLDEAGRRRVALVSAVLTIVRWHHARRDPAPLDGRRFAGFEVWCERVRDPLIALGHADPVAALDVTRGADLEIVRLNGLMQQWEHQFGDLLQTCGDAVKAANERDSYNDLRNAEFSDAVTLVTGDRPGAVSARKLSHYLARHEGRILGQQRFMRGEAQHKLIRWKLAKCDEK